MMCLCAIKKLLTSLIHYALGNCWLMQISVEHCYENAHQKRCCATANLLVPWRAGIRGAIGLSVPSGRTVGQGRVNDFPARFKFQDWHSMCKTNCASYIQR